MSDQVRVGGFLDFVPAYDDVDGEQLEKAEQNRGYVDVALIIAAVVVALYALARIGFLLVFGFLVVSGGNHTFFQPLGARGVPLGDAYEVGAAKHVSPDAIAAKLRTTVTAAFSIPSDTGLATDNSQFVGHVFAPAAYTYWTSRPAKAPNTVIDATVQSIRPLSGGSSFEISWTALEQTNAHPIEAHCVVDVTVGRFSGPPVTDQHPRQFWEKNALQIAVLTMSTPLGDVPPPQCNEPVPGAGAHK